MRAHTHTHTVLSFYEKRILNTVMNFAQSSLPATANPNQITLQMCHKDKVISMTFKITEFKKA